VGLGSEELLPGRSSSPRCGVDAGLVQDLPYRAGGDLVAEADQFTVDPAMTPRRVLRGQAQHQVTDLRRDRWPAGFGVRVGPVPGDQLAVPAQHRRRGDEEDRPACAGQQPRQGRQHDPVGRLDLGTVYLSAEHRDLVAQDQQFDVLGAVIAGQLGQHLQHLAQQQVHQRCAHDVAA
jgi:hypothetical protein